MFDHRAHSRYHRKLHGRSYSGIDANAPEAPLAAVRYGINLVRGDLMRCGTAP